VKIAELLGKASEQLAPISDSPRLDAEVLLCHVLQKNRSHLLAWPDKVVEKDQLTAFEKLLAKRIAGTPIAHLTGSREFWSLPLKVTADTLIPRPETELLVEQVLSTYPADTAISLLDLGTGTGAIALAIASERPNWRIIATDISSAALDVARENARQLGINNVEFRQGNWLDCVQDECFDIIVSNPPYIPREDKHLQQGDVRFEPLSALASGEDGLDDIRIIVRDSLDHLTPGGHLLIEHGYDQQQKMLEIFTFFGLQEIHQQQDMANNPRTTSGIKPI